MAMIVSHAKNFVFVHNPKAAGTAFRTAIEPWHDHPRTFWGIADSRYFAGQVDLAHLRSWELQVVAPDVFKSLETRQSLAFVRDPMPRFISACGEHFRNFRQSWHFLKLNATGRRLLIQWLVRSGRIEEGVRGDPRYVHFSPQVWFTHLGRQPVVRHILKLRHGREDLSEGFRLLDIPPVPPRAENRSGGPDWRELVSPDVTDFVRRFYALDYERLEL